MKLKKQTRSYSEDVKGFFKKHYKLKIFILLFSILVLFSAVSLISMYVGMVIYRAGEAGSINNKISDFAVSKFSFIQNYIKGKYAEPDNFIIDIKFKDLQKIRYYRNKSLELGYISQEGKDTDVPAKLTYRGETYKIKLSLTGTTLRHLGDAEKWSYRIKVKDDASILGLREFSILYPSSRGYLSDWIGHKIQEKVGLIALRVDYVNVTINGKDLGLYCLEENFDKILIESNSLKEGIIFKWGIIPQLYNQGTISSSTSLTTQSNNLRRLIKSFHIGEIGIDQLFDLSKMAKFFAVNDLLNGGVHGVHLNNTRFYFNPITNLVEPIGREWLMTLYKYKDYQNEMALSVEYLKDSIPFYNRFFNDTTFMRLYINELNVLSQKSFLDDLFNDIHGEMNSITHKIYRDNSFYIYPKEFLYNNQKYIHSKLYPDHSVTAFYNYIGSRNIQVLYRNLNCLPIIINGLVLNDTLLFKPKQNLKALDNHINESKFEELEILLPDISTGSEFKDKIEIAYHVYGLDSISFEEVFEWPFEDRYSNSLNATKREPNFQDFGFINVDQRNKEIILESGEIELSTDLIVPKGYTIIINENTIIDMINSASIISYSPIRLYGSEDYPILITSSDSTGQGLFVLNAGQESFLNHVRFEKLRNPNKIDWELTGAVTFYEADVTIDNCVFFKNISGDDFLNIVRSKFKMNDVMFVNTVADAFDADFCDGSVLAAKFINCGNDAIDISGSKVLIQDIFIDHAGDKGLSAGENSQMIAEDIRIENSEIAVCSKDKSGIRITGIHLINNKINFTAFKKKPEFGPGTIEVTDIEINDAVVPYLIEVNSRLLVDGKMLQSSDNESVKDLLYGVKYGKSSE